MKSTTSETPCNASHQVEVEWIEQYEPDVYTTLVTLRDGTGDLKRVGFSLRRFGEHQAELWWSENQEKVYEGYNICLSSEKSSVSGQRLPSCSSKTDGCICILRKLSTLTQRNSQFYFIFWFPFHVSYSLVILFN